MIPEDCKDYVAWLVRTELIKLQDADNPLFQGAIEKLIRILHALER